MKSLAGGAKEPDIEAIKRKFHSMELPELPIHFWVRSLRFLSSFTIPVVFGVISLHWVMKGPSDPTFFRLFFGTLSALILVFLLTKFVRMTITESGLRLNNLLGYSQGLGWESIDAVKVGYCWQGGGGGPYKIYIIRMYRKDRPIPFDIRWMDWKTDDVSTFLRILAKKVSAAAIDDQVYPLMAKELNHLEALNRLNPLPNSLVPGQDEAARSRGLWILWTIIGFMAIVGLVSFVVWGK